MTLGRETIYGALFARLQTLAPAPAGNGAVVTLSRRLKHWADTPPLMQPAIFQVQKREMPSQAPGRPPAWTLTVDLYLYVHAGADPTASPATALNAVLDQIDALLSPDVSGRQTLGGVVTHAWIDRAGIETDEGALGAQAVAIVPVTLEVAE